MPPSPPEVNHRRWFGFYHPEQASPVGPRAAFAELITVAEQPLHGRDEVLSFMQKLAAAIPSCGVIVRELTTRPVAIRFEEIKTPVYGETADGEAILLPSTTPPIEYLSSFIQAFAAIIPAPEGLELPPQNPTIPVKTSKDQIREALSLRHAWKMALAETFLFQAVHELFLGGIEFSRFEGGESLLTASDIAFFHILRSSGLSKLASSYPQFLLLEDREVLRVHFFEHRSSELPSTATATGKYKEWRPPQAGPKPELSRTHLDQKADHQQRYDKGFDGTPMEIKKLTKPEGLKLADLLRTVLTDETGIHPLIEALKKLSPGLAKKLLRPLEDGHCVVALTDTPYPHGGTLEISMVRLLGFPERETRIPRIWISRGKKVEDVLSIFVGSLAKLIIPPDYFSPISGNISIPVLENLVRERSAHLYAWSESACAQQFREAAKRGIPRVSLTVSEREKQKLLEVGGVAVLAQRLRDLMSPTDVELLESEATQVVIQVRRNLGLTD